MEERCFFDVYLRSRKSWMEEDLTNIWWYMLGLQSGLIVGSTGRIQVQTSLTYLFHSEMKPKSHARSNTWINSQNSIPNSIQGFDPVCLFFFFFDCSLSSLLYWLPSSVKSFQKSFLVRNFIHKHKFSEDRENKPFQ